MEKKNEQKKQENLKFKNKGTKFIIVHTYTPTEDGKAQTEEKRGTTKLTQDKHTYTLTHT